MVQILPTRAFRRLFWAFANRDRVRLTVVSPFLGGLPDFSSTVEFARFFLRNEESSLTLVTRPPRREAAGGEIAGPGREGILNDIQAEALVALGVDLRIRKSPPLHSKVYQLQIAEKKWVSFVGSANFSLGGFQKNDETVVFFGGEPENKQVDREVTRLTGTGSIPYRDWDMINRRSGGAL